MTNNSSKNPPRFRYYPYTLSGEYCGNRKDVALEMEADNLLLKHFPGTENRDFLTKVRVRTINKYEIPLSGFMNSDTDNDCNEADILGNLMHKDDGTLHQIPVELQEIEYWKELSLALDFVGVDVFERSCWLLDNYYGFSNKEIIAVTGRSQTAVVDAKRKVTLLLRDYFNAR